MDSRYLLSVINLMPQNPEVRDHIEIIASIGERYGCKVKSYQPRDRDSLRRAWINNCSMVYMIGHAEPTSGLELLNGNVTWSQWQWLFTENPHSAILNCCHSLPGVFWQPPGNSSVEIHGHKGLIKRDAAYGWGVEKLKTMLSVLISSPIPR